MSHHVREEGFGPGKRARRNHRLAQDRRITHRRTVRPMRVDRSPCMMGPRVRLAPPNPTDQLGDARIRRRGTRDDDEVCTPQRRRGFAQPPGRQAMAVDPRARGIDQHDVQGATHLTMLESVVEHGDVDGRMHGACLGDRRRAVGTHGHANAGQLRAVLLGLVRNPAHGAVAAQRHHGRVAGFEEAGVGATLTLPLGGNTDMPSIGRAGEPLTVTGRVRALTDGDFVVTVPMGRGTTRSMGPSALLDLGGVQVVVISRHCEPNDPGCFRSLGIEPTAKRYLLLKSRIHHRAGFQEMAKAEIPCAGVGVTSSDNTLFDFRRVRRPIYPLDENCPERPNTAS